MTASLPLLPENRFWGQINSERVDRYPDRRDPLFRRNRIRDERLIVAYRTAAAEAIAAAEIEERTVDEDITIAFEYPYLNGIMRIVKEENPVIVSQKFEMDCEMTLRIRKGEAERLKARLLKVESVYIPRTEF